jgi:hypothetical protein
MFGAKLRLGLGALLILVILFGQDLIGMATAGNRLDPALRNVTEPVNVVVVLDFTPERFHNERLTRYGVFAGRDRAVNRLRLRMVTPENLQRLASIVWIDRIEKGR